MIIELHNNYPNVWNLPFFDKEKDRMFPYSSLYFDQFDNSSLTYTIENYYDQISYGTSILAQTLQLYTYKTSSLPSVINNIYYKSLGYNDTFEVKIQSFEERLGLSDFHSIDLFYFAMLIYPPITFVHGLYIILISGSFTNLDVQNITGKGYSQIDQVILALIFQSLIYFLFGYYLFNVLPKKNGLSFSPFYPFKLLNKLFESKSNIHNDHKNQDPETIDMEKIKEYGIWELERENAMNSINSVFRTINLGKVYIKSNEALTDINIVGEKGDIIGLLGPNGAGKSTFINILSGLIKPTYGKVYIMGYDMDSHIERAYQYISYCGQFDILYEDLTIEYHIIFYTILKQNSTFIFKDKNEIKQNCQSLLKKMHLEQYKDKKIKECSGGIQRKLSICLSLIGNSKLIFMDEPTNGLDQDNRELVYETIKSIKQDKTIVLTTHNMKEAQILCNKIAILSKGKLKAVGTTNQLKNSYGLGYQVDVFFKNHEYGSNLNNLILTNFPSAIKKKSISDFLYSYSIPKDSNLDFIFYLYKKKKENGILDLKITQSTFEDILIKVVENDLPM
ncbi:hypothetical protein CYY_006469 [Polysphondylium violaceum]|uniref:ABC transporter domain-containing protein n=1 Tax=Polysphondylium violaceum TaxID=133409 RepID=A0A8J4V5X9_9MYCE|nr:hypothetical protein CYY_006469 [Polysphondylium violaceum]